MERLRFGIFVVAGRYPGQDDAAALRRALDTVVAAERAGFDDAWIAEHHFMTYGVCPSAVTFAAHVLGRTDRITVGTAVSVLSTVHPVALAEQTALLDQISDGRFYLGVGRGGPWVDLEVFGTGLTRYEKGFPDSLDLLLRGLTDATVGAGGAGDAGDAGSADSPAERSTFRFREVPIVPRPATRPRPPVAVACTSPVSIETAAERGLPMLLGMDLDDRQKADMAAHHAKAADRAGHDPHATSHISAMVTHVAADRDTGRRELLDSLPGWLGPGLAGYVPVDGRPPSRRDPHDYARRLVDLHAVGSPAACVDRIGVAVEATGIRHLIMLVDGTGDAARAVDNVARIGAEVLPAFR